MWMNLETVMQSEISQEEENSLHIVYCNIQYNHIVYQHIYLESRKMVLMDLFAGQE